MQKKKNTNGTVTHQALGNESVLRRVHCTPLSEELRARLLKWWQTICRNPIENSTLLATLFGSLVFDSDNNDFSANPVFVNASPWVKQFDADL